MYTSETDRRLASGIRYLIAALIVAAAGWVYELFSHGIYSNYMIYAFMVPLAAGALPDLLMAARGNKKRAARSMVPDTAAGLRLAAIVTLTTGSIVKGVLEIYGTTNRLTIVYPIIGIALFIAALAAFILHASAANGECAEQEQTRYQQGSPQQYR